MLGADVGGVLSMVPAFGVTTLVLLGRRPTLKQFVGLVALAGVIVMVFAFIDIARPEGSRTHLARLAQHVVDGRWGRLLRQSQSTPARQLRQRRGRRPGPGSPRSVLATAVYVAMMAVRRRRPNFSIDLGRSLDGPARAARDGLVVLAVVGLVANDSSIAVPATMLIVIVPALVLYRITRGSTGDVGTPRVTVLLAGAAGYVAVVLLLATTSAVLAHPTLERENYRGHRLPTAAGFLLVAAVVAVDGARTLLGIVGLGDAGTAPDRVLILGAVVMFGFLGLVDDLLGDAADRGLRRPLRAALAGRVTTGFVKLGGGVAVALVLAGADRRRPPGSGPRRRRPHRPGRQPRQPARPGAGPHHQVRPGRLCARSRRRPAPAAHRRGPRPWWPGRGPRLLLGDLRERFMLGDTGANAFGAALGVATVLVASLTVRAVVAARAPLPHPAVGGRVVQPDHRSGPAAARGSTGSGGARWRSSA